MRGAGRERPPLFDFFSRCFSFFSFLRFFFYATVFFFFFDASHRRSSRRVNSSSIKSSQGKSKNTNGRNKDIEFSPFSQIKKKEKKKE